MMLLLLSCDAPRDNLLDPNNPENTIHTLNGRVQTSSVPFQPIEGVNITVKDEYIVTQSDASGYFKLDFYEGKNLLLYFQKSGYHYDSSTVEWQGIKRANVNIHLNAKPKLDSVAFYSSVQYKYPDNKTTSLTIKTIISDEEHDDINHVLIENPFYNLNKILTYDLGNSCYELTLTSSDLFTTDIESVIGKDFNIIVQNSAGDSFTIGATNIKRIINQQPEFISPANNIDTITVGPTLKWRRFEVGFLFNYHVQIYTNEIWPMLVWEKPDIASTEIEIEVEPGLSAGEYFWVIWCIDEFQNRVRSKPASFQVRE